MWVVYFASVVHAVNKRYDGYDVHYGHHHDHFGRYNHHPHMYHHGRRDRNYNDYDFSTIISYALALTAMIAIGVGIYYVSLRSP